MILHPKLAGQVQDYIDKTARRERVIGMVAPHAGLMYSGPVAGAVYSAIDFPDTFVLIGPNHTGLGAPISLMESGEWEIPTGVFTIDETISYKIAMNVPIVTKDARAHMFEHSLEVQLPFIAFFSKQVKIVPIAVLAATVEECRMLGEGIAKAVKSAGYPVVVVASSDMSHYVPDAVARQKDKKAIDRILSLDPVGSLRDRDERKDIDVRISSCRNDAFCRKSPGRAIGETHPLYYVGRGKR